MDINLIPIIQPEPLKKEITFYSQCKKSAVPKHAKKISKEDLIKKKNSLCSEIVNKYLGDTKHCSYWIWDESVHQKYHQCTLHIGSNNCSEDYLVVSYNQQGNAFKIVHLRVSMFRENYDSKEILNYCSLTSEPTYLVKIFDNFNIKLSDYSYPIKEIKWVHSYKL